jgi:hypothetical protein
MTRKMQILTLSMLGIFTGAFLWLWMRYGDAVFQQYIDAALAWCF